MRELVRTVECVDHDSAQRWQRSAAGSLTAVGGAERSPSCGGPMNENNQRSNRP